MLKGFQKIPKDSEGYQKIQKIQVLGQPGIRKDTKDLNFRATKLFRRIPNFLKGFQNNSKEFQKDIEGFQNDSKCFQRIAKGFKRLSKNDPRAQKCSYCLKKVISTL